MNQLITNQTFCLIAFIAIQYGLSQPSDRLRMLSVLPASRGSLGMEFLVTGRVLFLSAKQKESTSSLVTESAKTGIVKLVKSFYKTVEKPFSEHIWNL